MKNIIYIFLLISVLAKAQDNHFSEFYLTPYALNPAMTGLFSGGDLRIMGVSRLQWPDALGLSKAYKTSAFASDMRLPAQSGRDYIGVGASFQTDKAGTSNFERTQVMISAAYCKNLRHKKSKDHFLLAGFEGGINNYNLSVENLRFLSQFNASDIYDASSPSPVFSEGYHDLHFGDMNAGIMWLTVMPKYYSFHIGASIYHANKPNVSFNAYKKMLPRLTLNFGSEYFLAHKRWALLTNVIAMKQGKSIELNSGASLRYTLQLEKSELPYKAVQAGAYLRINNKLEKSILADALVISARIDYDKFIFGISYDANISSLRVASPTNGAYEISMHRVFANRKNKGPICPNWNDKARFW